MNEFGQLLSIYMDILKIGDTELALYLGTDKNTIRNWKKNASVEKTYKLFENCLEIIKYLNYRITILSLHPRVVENQTLDIKLPDLESELSKLHEIFKEIVKNSNQETNVKQNNILLKCLSKTEKLLNDFHQLDDTSRQESSYQIWWLTAQMFELKAYGFDNCYQKNNHKENIRKWRNMAICYKVKALELLGDPSQLATKSEIDCNYIEPTTPMTTELIEIQARGITKKQIKKIFDCAAEIIPGAKICLSTKEYITKSWFNTPPSQNRFLKEATTNNIDKQDIQKLIGLNFQMFFLRIIYILEQEKKTMTITIRIERLEEELLPIGLQIMVLDESSQLISDNYQQTIVNQIDSVKFDPFRAEIGDEFKVKLALHGIETLEHFEI